MSLEEQFRKVADAVRNWEPEPFEDENFALYSLYKQATLGDVNIPEPSGDSVEKEKFKAWTNRKGISQDDAKKQYIELALNTVRAGGTATATATATVSPGGPTPDASSTVTVTSTTTATATATVTASRSATAIATATQSSAAADAKKLKSLPKDSDHLKSEELSDSKEEAQFKALTNK